MFLLWILGSYLLGSIPTGYLIARKARNINIMEIGSGNIGTTNISRILGPTYGVLVLILDSLKGFIPVIVGLLTHQASWWPIDRPSLVVLMACAAVLGHSKSIWLKFRGGKGAATGLGTLLGMAFPIALLAGAIFLIVVWYTRFVSLGSMLAAIAVPLFMWLFLQPLPYILYGIALAIFIIIRHRDNIDRLLKKEEPQFFFKQEDS